MQARPRPKAYRKTRFHRCPKCNKMLRKHVKRCKTCHLVQPKL